MTVTVYHGDCMDVLPTLAAGSVQCCVTSPPYFGLRAYPHAPTAWPEIAFVPVAGLPALTVPAQVCHLGAEADPWAYVAHLVHAFRAVRRVLRDDGTLWLNLGDSYASDSKWGGASGGIQIGSGPEKVPRLRRQTGLGDKQQLLIPSRVALALQADGWWLRTDVIWEKPNAMPESVTDRPTRSYEHILVFARRARYYYDAEAIAEPAAVGHRGSRFSTGKTRVAREQTGAAVGQRDREDRATRNARDVWKISTRSYPGAHFAVFPEELPERCILAGTPPQACNHCGAPWRRLVARCAPDPLRPQARRARDIWTQAGLTEAHLHAVRAVGLADAGKAQQTMRGAGANTPEVQRLAAEAKAALGGYYREFLSGPCQTVAWQPTCACPDNTGTGRSLVLDPFGGSGTTGAAAARLGRDTILIEAAADYLPLIAQRTDQRPIPRRPPPPPPRRGGHPTEEEPCR